ncbi:MAG: DUF1573 domain-containing protein [Bacteroidales bacterium]|nr:DUF1573 domain-containing protein [Bacteroidales bacterium]
MRKIATLLCAILTIGMAGQTRSSSSGISIDGKVELDKNVHDFGDVLLGTPISCSFAVKNISSETMVIYNVAQSCGCTDVDWTRTDIAPGESGTVKATYTNDEGAYPFSKSLTVYISSLPKPVVLRFRGTSRSEVLPLAQRYPVHLGSLALKDRVFAAGNMGQGSQRTDAFTVANIGKKTMELSFEDISDCLSVSPRRLTIPAGETARVSYTVTSSREHWGKNWYCMTPVVGGTKMDKIEIWAFTKEDFSSWSKADRDKAAEPVFEASTANLGVLRGGKAKAVFTLTNRGKSPLHIYKADCEDPAVSVSDIKDVPAGGKGTIEAEVDVERLEKGEFTLIVTLTTNTPLRPLINLFIAGAKQ